MTQAEAKKHVTRACQLRGFDLVTGPCVLVIAHGKVIVDAESWQDASEQFSAWARAQYH